MRGANRAYLGTVAVAISSKLFFPSVTTRWLAQLSYVLRLVTPTYHCPSFWQFLCYSIDLDTFIRYLIRLLTEQCLPNWKYERNVVNHYTRSKYSSSLPALLRHIIWLQRHLVQIFLFDALIRWRTEQQINCFRPFLQGAVILSAFVTNLVSSTLKHSPPLSSLHTFRTNGNWRKACVAAWVLGTFSRFAVVLYALLVQEFQHPWYTCLHGLYLFHKLLAVH